MRRIFRFYTIFSCLFVFSLIFEGSKVVAGDNLIFNFEVESHSSLSFTYGWLRNEKNGKWITKENEIKDIDSFDSYTLISFLQNDIKYIAVIKKQSEGSFWLFDTYLIDYNTYVEKMGEEINDAVLRFPILKHFKSKQKKNTLVSKTTLGLNDLNDLLPFPRDFFVFQYRFDLDSIVKFLLYTESCNTDTCVPNGLNLKSDNRQILRYVGSERLYDHLYYKTTYNEFIKFIDSPLSANN